jgi:hypothetical protein
MEGIGIFDPPQANDGSKLPDDTLKLANVG